ncbi:hypothetical protein ACQCVP_18145 [Rossellomorea vietnamensis]|uniref:hypothetical protein n=1 Tax=Rossellomorea vietnamensis TaxID=218284 RepID=UPI003CF2F7F1
MVRLDSFSVDFDCTKEAPYFQVPQEQRIRFVMEDLSVSLIRGVIEDVYDAGDALTVIFVSEYIVNNRRRSFKSRIGRSVKITNWQETVVYDESLREGIVYTSIRNLIREDVITYCSAIYKGQNEAFLAFYNEKFLVYVSSDVIDIISSDRGLIAELKQGYSGLFNRFYEDS